MNDYDWVIIDALYKQKSISKAGRELYISQPTLTKRLKQIEKEIGVKIANRGAKGIQFTMQGEYLAKRATEMIKLNEEIRQEVISIGDNIAGTLKIGVSIYFSKYELPKLVSDFRRKYPEVDFDVKTGHSSYIYNLISNKEIHVGFLRSDYEWQDEKYMLFKEKLCLVSKNPISFDKLPDMERVDYKQDYLLKGLLDRWWSENFKTKPNVMINVSSADICKELVMRGLGYGILPHRMINEEDDELYVLDLKGTDGGSIDRNTWMYYHAESISNPVVDAFIDFIEQNEFNRLVKKHTH